MPHGAVKNTKQNKTTEAPFGGGEAKHIRAGWASTPRVDLYNTAKMLEFKVLKERVEEWTIALGLKARIQSLAFHKLRPVKII